MKASSVKSGVMAAGALAAAVASTSAAAVASYDASATASFSLLAGAVDGDFDAPITLDIELFSNEGVIEESLGGVASADAGTGTEVFNAFDPVYDFSANASASGSAEAGASGFADSFADGFAAFELELTNYGDADLEIFGEIAMSLDTVAMVDDASLEYADAMAEVFVTSLNNGNLGAITGVPSSIFSSAGGTGPLMAANSESVVSQAVTLFIGAGQTESVFVDVYATGYSESLVPVPAALPLLVSGLAGGALFGRKKAVARAA